MITALTARPQTVTEVSPAADSWQANWSAWHQPEHQQSGGKPRSQARKPVSSGCGNLRTLLSAESLGEVWEAMPGRTSSQDYVIDGWTQLLRLN